MAQPTDFEGANLSLGAPRGRDDVAELRVMKNRQSVVSCWELSPEELAEVMRTGKVYLAVMGENMAPAYVASETEMRLFTADFGMLPKQPTDPA